MTIPSHLRTTLFLMTGVVGMFFLAACDSGGGGGDDLPSTNVDALTYTQSRSDMQAFAAAVNQTDLASTLEGDGSFTVFVPQSQFMSALNVEGLTDPDALNDVGLLQDVLSYHVIQGEALTASQLGNSATSLEGAELSFSGGAVNGVNIVTDGTGGVNGGIEVTNGVVHLIDGVLFDFANSAEYIKASSSTSTLATALSAEGNLEGPLAGTESTVFAPLNGAFGAIDTDDLLADPDLLTEVLSYHAVLGSITAGDITDGQTVETVEGDDIEFSVSDEGAVSVNGIPVEAADIETTNGVIHLIGGTLLETLTVADRAVLEPSTETLVAALSDAGLTGSLSDETSTFTVFAPSNGALARLDVNEDGTVSDELSGSPGERVLDYHVVPGERIPAVGSGLSDGVTPKTTLDNFDVDIGVDADTVRTVNSVPITGSATASNGVIHFIDAPLLQSTTIAERATLTPSLTSLLEGAVEAGLEGALDDENELFTVFAPTDDAFEALEFEELGLTGGLAEDVIGYHVVEDGSVVSSDITDGQTLTTLQGSDLDFRTFGDGTITVNGFPLTTTDIQSRNGVVHLIGNVLLSQTTIAQRVTLDPSLSSLQDAVDVAGLGTTLGDENATFTVFAPTDNAFEALDLDELTGGLAEDVIGYHVVENESVGSSDIIDGQTLTTRQGSDLDFQIFDDGTITVNGFPLATTDIQSSNGVVHLIDNVLLSQTTIAQRVTLARAFSSLQTALERTGLDAPLGDDNGAFTVFAPTNDAFSAFLGDDGSLEDIPNSELEPVLRYHVLDEPVASSDIDDDTQPKSTLEGSELAFGIRDGSVVLNPSADSASVGPANVPAENGLIHVIDTVLTPPEEE